MLYHIVEPLSVVDVLYSKYSSDGNTIFVRSYLQAPFATFGTVYGTKVGTGEVVGGGEVFAAGFVA